MNKVKFLIIQIVLLVIVPMGIARADGCMIAPDYQDEDIYEPSQTALIVYDEGIEDLYLKVNYVGNASEFIWLVPTPAYPDVTEAADDIFLELSSLTTTASWRALDNAGMDLESKGVTNNVIVHEQKNVGIYEVTVLSAAGTDGLFDWLNDNGYKLKEEVREVLDWYVGNEWYFTVMRISLDDQKERALEEYRKLDKTATLENITEKLSQYYTDAFKYKNYDNFSNVIDIIEILSPEYIEDIKGEVDSKEDFFLLIAEEGIDDYTELDWLDAKDEVKRYFEDELSGDENTDIYKYSDYIEPIKISFNSNSIVYPLKISQVSTRVPSDINELPKTNEVLLYVVSEEQVKAPEFITEYSGEINTSKLEEAESNLYTEDLNSLKEIVGDRELFLTKMRRDFAKAEMDDDLYFVAGTNPSNILRFELKLLKGDNCVNCIEAISFLDKIESYYSDYLVVEEYEFYSIEENKTIYDQVAREGGLESLGELLFIVEDSYVAGFENEETSGRSIKNMIDKKILKKLSESYDENKSYTEARENTHGSAMSDRLKGKIIIKVEDNGKAYYINPTTHYSHYLGRPADAFKVMRDQGVGITNVNLEKIPVGVNSVSGNDSDNDGLSDLLEDAIGTDKNNKDSDGDGYDDRTELVANYNPAGSGELVLDTNFTASQKGKIFLQVESSGEAWYVNPQDGKRYFLGRPADAFSVMRNLGLGISNIDFDEL